MARDASDEMIIVIFILCFVLAFVLILLLTRKWDESSNTVTSEFNLGPLLNKASALMGGAGVRTRIVFNGKEYASQEEMPVDVRQAYDQAMGTVLADADRNGIPDIFETGGSATFVHSGLLTNTSEDPAEKLKTLKEMRDSGLITTEEFEAKKTEILNRM